MRKLLTRALLVTALSSASMMAFADGFGIPYYARGPRIIHVPQPGDDLRDSRASLRSDAPEDFDDDPVSVAPPRRAVQPAPKTPPRKVAKTGTHQEPRRKPFSVSLPEPPPPPPEPTGPRRALLSAPPPTSSLSDGPTPIRPTPRFAAPVPEPAAPAPDAVTAAMPAPEPAASAPVDTSDDHLPPPGDPRLAPPEPNH